MQNTSYTATIIIACTSWVAQAAVHEISAENELNALLKKDKPVVVKFYSDWCGPCKQSKQPFEKIAQQKTEDATFAAVNTKHKAPWISKYVKSGVPTFVVLVSGKGSVASRAGYGGESDLRNWIEQGLAPYKKKN